MATSSEILGFDLEVVSRIPVTNVALDPYTVLMNPRAAHTDGSVDAGIDWFSSEIVNCYDERIVAPEPALEQALTGATDGATHLLLDDIVLASDLAEADSEAKTSDE